MKKYIIQFLVGVIFVGLVAEIYFRYVDPDGLYHYLSVWENLPVEPAPHGYVFKQGVYNLGRWQVTINADGFRHLDTKESNCKIALIGDSVTFGWGVSDGLIWAQLLANEADATILMRSHPSYNIDNIKAVYGELEALGDIDGYIYLMVANDAQGAVSADRFDEYATKRTALEYRFLYMQRVANRVTPPENIPHFKEQFMQMTSDKMLTIGVQSSAPFIQAVQDITPYWIVPSMHTVSLSDGHANAEGNAEMYAQIRTYALPFIEAVCIDHRT